MFLDNTWINIELVYMYLKTSKPLNRLHSFMDQFVLYIHGKVRRQVFNIIAQYAWKNNELTLQHVGR